MSSIKDSLGVENSQELTEGLTLLASEANLLQEESKDWERICEILQKKLEEKNLELNRRPSIELVENLSNRGKKLVKKIITLLTEKELERSKYLEIIKDRQSKINELKTATSKTSNTIEALKERVKKLIDSNKNKDSEINILKEEVALKEEEARILGTELNESLKPANIPFNEMQTPIPGLKFQQNDRIKLYYEDLIERHGTTIEAHKTSILSCKTITEAMNYYLKNILPNLDQEYLSAARLPESTSLSREERRVVLEESTGAKFVNHNSGHLKKPDGFR
jgi:hypothetical protein